MKKFLTLGMILALLGTLSVACVRKPQEEADLSFPAEYAQGEELLCLAASQEDAQHIADLYGIELVSFAEGVATFHTEEDPREVIKRGTENGYPALELNEIVTLSH